MPTPSDPDPSHGSNWAARPGQNRRSVFGNYHSASQGATPNAEARVPNESSTPRSPGHAGTAGPVPPVPLQAAIDFALARSFLYRFLAKAYEDPSEDAWATLTGEELRPAVAAAALTLATRTPVLAESAHAFFERLRSETLEDHLSVYVACFGHAARGRCPMNEIEYGDLKADPLFQPHRLADLAAFYRAFGMSLSEDAHERHDHVCLECEFMCVLAAKEAYALEHDLGPEQIGICRDAERKFLREHVGRWTPAFARRLQAMAGDSALGVLATLTGVFVAAECARFGVAPGSEDLLLRPADPQAESLCATCGPTI
jgi:putative dimethyl sulfoxide reductase chaperone